MATRNISLVLAVMFVCVVSFSGCGARQVAAVVTVDDDDGSEVMDDGDSDEDVMEPSSSVEPSFDPREFLCRFTGGPAGESHDMMSGRRFTPAERARARAQIVVELQRVEGLAVREHNFRWIEQDRQWMSREHVDTNGGGGINLLAELRATVETDRWILVGAHYDSVATTPGADDNASGVTATIMVARQLAALPVRNANVLFAFFDQEEEGLIGSHALAQMFADEHWNVLAGHIIDMIGWEMDGDNVVELAHCGLPVAPNDHLLQLYVRAAERLNARAGETRIGGVVRRDSCRSDHVYLTEYGIPSVQSCEEFSGDDVTPYYHCPGDTCDTLDYEFLRSLAELVAEAVTIQIQ